MNRGPIHSLYLIILVFTLLFSVAYANQCEDVCNDRFKKIKGANTTCQDVCLPQYTIRTTEIGYNYTTCIAYSYMNSETSFIKAAPNNPCLDETYFTKTGMWVGSESYLLNLTARDSTFSDYPLTVTYINRLAPTLSAKSRACVLGCSGALAKFPVDVCFRCTF